MLVTLPACSGGSDELARPRASDLARLEARLDGHACVGPIENWERNYRFAMTEPMFWPQSGHPNLDIVEFHYRRAGTTTIAAGRRVIAPGEDATWPDSSSIRTLDGTFSITSGRLHLTRCRPLE